MEEFSFKAHDAGKQVRPAVSRFPQRRAQREGLTCPAQGIRERPFRLELPRPVPPRAPACLQGLDLPDFTIW